MDVNKGMIDKKSENLDAKLVTLPQPSCVMGDCRIPVAAI